MNNTMTDMDCSRVIERLDLYLDHELSEAERESLRQHFASCDVCNQTLTKRTLMRGRLRSAARGVMAPEGLRARISDDVLKTPARRPVSKVSRWTAGIAAAAMIATGLGAAYELGHLRLTAASRESYFARIAQRVSGVMRVGLGDHVHCAVFRKFKTQPPSPEKVAADMGPEFLPLVQLVRDQLPGDQRVMLAHRCGYHGRRFVHLSMLDGTHVSSLVIADRQPGETFQSSGLVPAMQDAGLPIYHSSVQRFQIDGFQTSAHLVYFISDMPKDGNQQMMAKIAKPVREFLNKLEL